MSTDTPRTDGLPEWRKRLEYLAGLEAMQRNDTLERELIAERALREAAESTLASLADTVAAAHRNTGMSDEGIELGIDLRDFIWQLSYRANENKQRELAAIASWDEERLRSEREGKRVVEAVGERDALRAELATIQKP